MPQDGSTDENDAVCKVCGCDNGSKSENSCIAGFYDFYNDLGDGAVAVIGGHLSVKDEAEGYEQQRDCTQARGLERDE